MANFNYCPLVCIFSNAASLKKIENHQKRALRFLYKTYNTSYQNLLLKSGFSSMNIKRVRILCVEIFKTLNSLNPSFMKEIFSLRQTDKPVREKYKLNLDIPSYNQVTFGRKDLTFFGSNTWNSLPYLLQFAITCSCKICFRK